ncbi:MAG: exo-alpha-sialidase [Betaproteobacteria bacterium]
MPTLRSCVLALLTSSSLAAAAAAPAPVPYAWKSVAIGGGGFVDGLVPHPSAPGLLYARTDMGGAYRRDGATQPWQPLLDWLPYADLNLMGVESIAVDASDPDKVYLACGTYTAPDVPDGAVLRSTDRGRTFRRTDLPVKFGGNEEGRGNGERLAVDPNDGQVLFLGTRLAGLWKSADGAASFQPVAGLPAQAWQRSSLDGPLPAYRGSDGRGGVVFVIFDPRSGTPGHASQTLYLGVSTQGRPNLHRSQDGGATWQPLPGQPTGYGPTRAVLAADGNLYVSYGNDPGPRGMTDGAVWRFDPRAGTWTDITPDKPDAARRFGYAAVSVDARDPRRLVASTFHRAQGEELFRSTDSGATWKPVFAAGAVFDAALAPYVKDTPLHWLFDVEIDPADPDHALFTTGYGGWETFDLTQADQGRPTHWRVMARGIEETVALALYSPTRGVPLVTGLGDYSGFVHADLDAPPPDGSPMPPFMSHTWDVAGADARPEVMVRVGDPRRGKGLGYSLDGGRHWREPATVPDARSAAGAIAVSADGATWVWTPRGELPQVTRDRGEHWTPIAGLPRDARVVADRVDPRRFHAMSLFEGKLYGSTDGAARFTERPLDLPDGPVLRGTDGANNRSDRGDDRGGQDRLYATPGKRGELWLAAWHGLYRAADGKPFARLPGVEQVHAFGFGKAAPGARLPALYMVGTVQGRRGIFRSTDGARHWLRINDDAHQWGLVLQIAGDPKTFGRVYVGTHGRGVLRGDPSGR